MDITEVRIKLVEEAGERLQAFCSITFDNCFVVRDLKIIGGTSGAFVAMPSRKLTCHCSGCGCKNHLRAAFCNHCGAKLPADRAAREEDGRAKLYADIAHPINSSCREMIQQRVIQAFHAEIERSKMPGYVSSYDDFDEEAPPEPASRRAAESARFEPAQQHPRGPHRGAPAPTAEPAATIATPHSRLTEKQATSFGAGILEEK